MDEFLFSDFSNDDISTYITEYRDHPLKRTRELLTDVSSANASELDPPINEVIDSDSLERLLSSAQNPTQVTFEYNEYKITITNSNKIHIEKS